MNVFMILYTVGTLLKVEAALMLLPAAVGLLYKENPVAFLLTIAALLAVGQAMAWKKPRNTAIYAKEGFLIVGLSWTLMSIFGALPFVISGEIPRFVDAFLRRYPALPPPVPAF